MRSSFRALERRRAAYLLISGQACVLYGASTFSEDFDLWVQPTAANLERLLAALRDVGARYYKLTPAPSVSLLRKGHGLHFLVPDEAQGEAFLDVMGCPPRVGAFGASLGRARIVDTGWGRVPVVSEEDLVEIKKTRRPADYTAISNLARVRVARALAEGERPARLRRIARWALENAFQVDTILWILGRVAGARDLALGAARASIRTAAAAWRPGVDELPAAADDRVEAKIAEEMGRLHKADAAYWRPIIHELRELRREGRLVPEGTPV
jgi:hypothetical protein